MRKNRDSRVNSNELNFRTYVKMFVLILFICMADTIIYWKYSKMQEGQFYMILSMFGYVLVVSIVLLISLDLYRRYIFMKPVYSLSSAAKKVAAGDYSVRIASQRKDGKKDEFEVLFEDFNQMVKELQSTELMKNDFISNVSHELKTPLAVISNYATILQDVSLSENQRVEYSGKIVEASVRMSVLVTNILQLNRLEYQKIIPTKKEYNLSEQLCRCIIGYDHLLDEKNIDLQTDFDENIVINVDENLLDIVWNNLISNAIKFTNQEGSIRIEAKSKEDEIIVKMQDSGCGMNETDVKHIFDKFYQADTSRATQGNGLGLAMVKKIVELFDGKIQVNSVLGKGTEFIIVFPFKMND